MGQMKNLHITIHSGGDKAVTAFELLSNGWREQLEQAASEIERLTLTRKERRILAWAAKHFGSFKNQRDTILGLLERTK
jgi:hypothetical protein